MRRWLALCVLSLGCQDDRAHAQADRPTQCPEGMVRVPGGTFTMGCTKAMERELPWACVQIPRHTVTLTQPYCVDTTEVTAGAYRKCVAAGVCRRNNCNAQWDDRVDHPMNCVTWVEANTYCTWAGRRLPTEAEWEFAARGPKSFRHPWGNSKPNDRKLWYSGFKNHSMRTAPVGVHPAGASPFGAQDMEGNVSEWVADWFEPGTTRPQKDPRGPETGAGRVSKGSGMDSGALYESDVGDRHCVWGDIDPGLEDGFRCAMSL